MSTRVVAASREIDGKGRTVREQQFRPNAPGSRVVSRTRDEQPVSIFQQLARGHPSGGDDVRAIPLSLRNVEDLLAERGIDISHETVRFWRNRFGPMFAAAAVAREARWIRHSTGARMTPMRGHEATKASATLRTWVCDGHDGCAGA